MWGPGDTKMNLRWFLLSRSSQTCEGDWQGARVPIPRNERNDREGSEEGAREPLLGQGGLLGKVDHLSCPFVFVF